MNFTEYSALALRTAKQLPHALQVQHAQLGMLTESGEFADMIKRHFIYGKDINKENGIEEVGDYLWYLNLYISENDDISLEEIDAALMMRLKREETLPTLVELAISFGVITASLLVTAEERGASDNVAMTVALLTARLLCEALGSDLETAMSINIRKLALRYGDKYSDYRALNRDLAAEGKVLANGAS